MRKRFIINGRFLAQRITGVQRYAIEIVKALDRIIDTSEQIELVVPPDAEITLPLQKIQIRKIGHLRGHLWEQISLPIYVIRHMGGVPINFCVSSPLICPGIVYVHDAKTKVRPGDFSKLYLIWYKILILNAMKRAKLILATSKFTKKELCKYYHVDPERIGIVGCGWQHFQGIGYDENALTRHGLVKDAYYFSLSSLEPNKNLKWVAEAANKNPDQSFAVAGSINERVFSDGLGFECPQNMKLLGYVSDEEAKTLMRDCRAFIFPSFYEGFGIPPLEAISVGAKRVIVSDLPVMHENFGDGVNYVDPNNAACCDLLSLKIISEQERERILGQHSWEKSARELLSILVRLRV